MVIKAGPDLKFRFVWLVIGYALVALVLYLSLTSQPINVKVGLPFVDKFFHAFAYFVLMVWFAQLYHDKFQRYMIALILIIIGVVLEYLQSFDAARMSEFADMVANTTGVVLAFSLTLTRAKNCLISIESWIN